MQEDTTHLLETVLEADNMRAAMRRVVGNKGAGGVDGISIQDAPTHFKEKWPDIRSQLVADTYRPKPVRQVEIPKPNGDMRMLGIPTVTDRVIQQAILQVLTPIFDPTFSDNSYGFRPKRSAHGAVEQARRHIEDGYTYVVDLDLAKFFDHVNHDRLMARLADTVKDKRVLKLIRRYLQAGAATGEGRDKTGTPQGGPLSPLLANIVLDEFDKELEDRGHKFVRYADDCNIFVRSQRAGERVLQSVGKYLDNRLRLPVNWDKSSVGWFSTQSFLGFTIYRHQKIRVAISRKSKKKLKEKIKALTPRKNSYKPMKHVIEELNTALRGWFGYYRVGASNTFLEEMDRYARRRLRMKYWKAWKLPRTKERKLKSLGMEDELAHMNANTRKGYWRVSNSHILSTTLTNRYFRTTGLYSLHESFRNWRLERK